MTSIYSKLVDITNNHSPLLPTTIPFAQDAMTQIIKIIDELQCQDSGQYGFRLTAHSHVYYSRPLTPKARSWPRILHQHSKREYPGCDVFDPRTNGAIPYPMINICRERNLLKHLSYVNGVVDMMAIQHARAVYADIAVPSVGVTQELIWARSYRLPVYALALHRERTSLFNHLYVTHWI